MTILFRASTDEQIETFLKQQGFICVRKLPDGEWIGLLKLAFTMSVCCGIEEITPFKYRWCFADPVEALHLYTTIEEYDEIPHADHRHSLKGHRWTTEPRIRLNDENGFPRW